MKLLRLNGFFNERQSGRMRERRGRRRADVKVGRESSNQFEYNTNGFNRNHRRFVRVRGCPNVRGANKRDVAATAIQREIKEKRTQLTEKRYEEKKNRKRGKKGKR